MTDLNTLIEAELKDAHQAVERYLKLVPVLARNLQNARKDCIKVFYKECMKTTRLDSIFNTEAAEKSKERSSTLDSIERYIVEGAAMYENKREKWDNYSGLKLLLKIEQDMIQLKEEYTNIKAAFEKHDVHFPKSLPIQRPQNTWAKTA